jgi:azurin
MKNINNLNKAFIIGLLTLSDIAFAQSTFRPALTEEDFYQIKTISIPEGVKLEVGGLAVLPDGRLGVSTRRGDIWVVENPYMTNGTQPYYSLFASGMHEPLGLAYRDGSFYCTQRGELTKITDIDGDGRADLYESICNFDVSGNYHEYAYGPVFDKNGDMYVTLNVAWIGYGEGLAKWHGWLLKVHPDGKQEPIATGLRSPAGFMLNSSGDILYADNQGDWIASGKVTHLVEGDFAGNAGGLMWTQEAESPVKLTKEQLKIVDTGEPMHEAAKKIKEMKLPAVWFPHTLMGISTSDIQEDTTRGAFGPFTGQYFVADQGHSKIMRMTLEKVNNEYQGACYPFREGFSSGLLRLRWGLDGSLFAGMTSRGWASTGKELYGLQRLVWTGKIPFEMKNVQAWPDGFEIEFTLPVDKESAQNGANYQVNSFTYSYHHQYGSPVKDIEEGDISGIIISEDGKKVRLVLDSLRKGYIYEVKLGGILAENKSKLLHDFAYYTLNNIPKGEKAQLAERQKIMKHEHQAALASAKMEGVTAISKSKPSGSHAKRLKKMPADWEKPDQVITVGTKPGLKFSLEAMQVKAGSKIKLIFNNDDDMTHNLVIVQPGTVNEVGMMALEMGLRGSELHYVPATSKVLYHTGLLQPNQSEAIYFTAPSQPGDYTFVCTFPGHYMVMQGTFKVVK